LILVRKLITRLLFGTPTHRE